MQIECSEGEVLGLAGGARKKKEVEARGARGLKAESIFENRCDSRARSRDRVGRKADGGERGENRAKVSSCGRAVSCSSDQQW